MFKIQASQRFIVSFQKKKKKKASGSLQIPLYTCAEDFILIDDNYLLITYIVEVLSKLNYLQMFLEID